ncbi:MAG: M24 family metallopeptidase [Nitriliruptoraceae bacterium]
MAPNARIGPRQPPDARTGWRPPHDHAARRTRLRELLTGERAGLLLVTEPRNVRYLTGFTGSNGQLLLGPDEASTRLITDQRYDGRAATEAGDLERVLDRDPIGVALGRMAEDAPAARLVVEADHLTWATARLLEARAGEVGVEVVATAGLVAGLRLVKDDAEVARLDAACTITTEALAWTLEQVVAPGVTERAVATALERRFVDLGADGIAFPSIVAAGPNGAVPHHEPGERPLRRGELVTIDCGALVDGYHADHTRTVALGTPADPELLAVHRTVEAAQAAGREAVRAGAIAADVDAAARAVIVEAGYGDAFVHGTGHGVGLDIHEAPAVAQGSTATLRPGIVLTVEPGIYLPGRGGVRIEDTVVVTAEPPARVLTDTPRELRIL